MNNRLTLIILITLSYSQYNYELMDINPVSLSYGETISPTYYQNQITLHYFGHQSWGLCATRVGDLDDLCQNLIDAGINNVKIIAIGKSEYSNDNGDWITGNSIPVLVDPSQYNTWSSWGASQRDLFFLDENGDYVTDFNISSWDYNAVYSQINLIINECTDITCGNGGSCSTPTINSYTCSECDDGYVGGVNSLCVEYPLSIQSNPEHISLFSAYPNPFNPSTNIIFFISQGSYSLISVYDMSGRYLETLYQSYFTPGRYTLTWNADQYSSGIYFIKLDTDFNTLSHKLVLAK